jgi:hypothetical protein
LLNYDNYIAINIYNDSTYILNKITKEDEIIPSSESFFNTNAIYQFENFFLGKRNAMFYIVNADNYKIARPLSLSGSSNISPLNKNAFIAYQKDSIYLYNNGNLTFLSKDICGGFVMVYNHPASQSFGLLNFCDSSLILKLYNLLTNEQKEFEYEYKPGYRTSYNEDVIMTSKFTYLVEQSENNTKIHQISNANFEIRSVDVSGRWLYLTSTDSLIAFYRDKNVILYDNNFNLVKESVSFEGLFSYPVSNQGPLNPAYFTSYSPQNYDPSIKEFYALDNKSKSVNTILTCNKDLYLGEVVQLDSVAYFTAYDRIKGFQVYKVSFQNYVSKSIEQATNSHFLYPNPTSGTLSVPGINEKSSCEIYNTSGVLLSTKIALDSKFDVTELQSGLYFLKYVSDGKSITLKFYKH